MLVKAVAKGNTFEGNVVTITCTMRELIMMTSSMIDANDCDVAMKATQRYGVNIGSNPETLAFNLWDSIDDFILQEAKEAGRRPDLY